MSASPTDYFHSSPDGLRLYCAIYQADRPDGLPILCLPGLTRNSRDFTALAGRLSERHTVLAADLRGRGNSARDRDPSHYVLPTYVLDAWSLMDARAIDRFFIVGTSLGALMGMVMAATAPHRVAGLVLNDAGPEIDPAGVRRIAGYAGQLPAVSSWAEASAQTKSVYGSALPGLSDEEWLAFAHQGYREDSLGRPVPDVDPAISNAFKNIAAPPADMWPLFAQIKVTPMLVIRGALSDLLSAATVRRMGREKPDLQELTVANRGHTPLLNEPECVAAINAFLADHGRTAEASAG